MTVELKEFLKDDAAHTSITDESLDLPNDFIFKSFTPIRKRRMISYWGIDNNGSFIILRKSISQKKNKYPEVNEAFVCMPINSKSDKCIAYYFSDYNHYLSDDKTVVNNILLNTLAHD